MLCSWPGSSLSFTRTGKILGKLSYRAGMRCLPVGCRLCTLLPDAERHLKPNALATNHARPLEEKSTLGLDGILDAIDFWAIKSGVQ